MDGDIYHRHDAGNGHTIRTNGRRRNWRRNWTRRWLFKDRRFARRGGCTLLGKGLAIRGLGPSGAIGIRKWAGINSRGATPNGRQQANRQDPRPQDPKAWMF
ncbi:MAG: hypothetical protein BZY88_07625 [SAR202 cluster bacterium Io17-Chloro-G9]|nr:MAG: hypothetical protein BZY88_07625 [SAR202 cluster bacterium Io17-Chloro-G9]